MARILIHTKRFPPESPATAVLGQELAAELAQAGHQVTVVAGYPNHPYGRLFPGYKQKLVSSSWEHGYRLIRGGHFIHPGGATVLRALVMASQCASAVMCAWYADRPQAVISFDGYPLLGPLTAALIAKASGARFISVIYDLYPDIAVELGKLTNPALISLARKLENLIYRLSDKIVVLSEGFHRTLVHGKGVAAGKVEVIPVWLDAQDIVPMPRDNPWRREMGIPQDTFVVLYAGTIGLVSGAEIVVGAAQQLTNHPDILLLLVGDGYGKEQVVRQVKEVGLTNVKFLPFQPRERLSELQASADVSLVTLAPGRGRTSVPSKVLGYMAAARPILASVDSDCDTARMINAAQCGLVIPPGDSAALTAAILNYYTQSDLRSLAGDRGRQYFLDHFEKKNVMQNYKALLNNLFIIKY